LLDAVSCKKGPKNGINNNFQIKKFVEKDTALEANSFKYNDLWKLIAEKGTGIKRDK
jgi:hypothetical protein